MKKSTLAVKQRLSLVVLKYLESKLPMNMIAAQVTYGC